MQNFSGQVQTALFHLHFLLPCCYFLPEKKNIAKNFLTELYKKLTVKLLSPDNSENLQFDALTDLYVELGVRLGYSIFVNHERAMLEKTGRRNKQKIWFFFFSDDQDDKKDVKIKSDT